MAAAGDVKAREELVKGSRRSRNGRVHRGGLGDNLRKWRLGADGAAADHERMLARYVDVSRPPASLDDARACLEWCLYLEDRPGRQLAAVIDKTVLI